MATHSTFCNARTCPRRSCDQAEVAAVDSADPINAWAAQQTRGLITVAVPPDSPFDLVLTNALYFKGLWQHAFDKAATLSQPFTLAGGRQVQVRPLAAALAGPQRPRAVLACS